MAIVASSMKRRVVELPWPHSFVLVYRRDLFLAHTVELAWLHICGEALARDALWLFHRRVQCPLRRLWVSSSVVA
jgi:hypothetical protein